MDIAAQPMTVQRRIRVKDDLRSPLGQPWVKDDPLEASHFKPNGVKDDPKESTAQLTQEVVGDEQTRRIWRHCRKAAETLTLGKIVAFRRSG